MIRLTLLTLFVSALSIYAWKDWYKSLCGLILLMAVIEHPDMPKTMFGIQGLNPWNIILFIIMIAWIASRRREGLSWDMPRHMNILLIFFLSVIVIGFFRMISDTSCIINYAIITGNNIPSTEKLWSEYLINPIKWGIPGLLLYDGCRSRSRFVIGLFSILAVYFLLSIQVIKWMPLSSALNVDSLEARSAKILVNEIGYHRVNLSVMLAGASWAIFSTRLLISRGGLIMLIIGVSLIVLFAQVLTAGRAGYISFAVVGLVLCFIRWRRYLLLLPLIVIIVVWLIPGVVERMSKGFTPETRDINPRIERHGFYNGDELDWYTITSGRNVALPYILGKIGEAPIFGHGRMAMQRTGLAALLWQEFGEGFPHPHNAYLELLLDNGIIGFVPVLVLLLLILKYSISLFRDSRNPIFVAIGGVTLSIVLAQLVGSFGSQSFYPREGSVGMWCAIGLMLRVFVKRSQSVSKELLSNSAGK